MRIEYYLPQWKLFYGKGKVEMWTGNLEFLIRQAEYL